MLICAEEIANSSPYLSINKLAIFQRMELQLLNDAIFIQPIITPAQALWCN